MRVIVLVAALVLSACDGGPSRDDLVDRVSELESENSYLRDQLDSAHTEATEASNAAQAAQSAVEEVGSQTDRFGYENWQYVVGDVQNAVSNAEAASSEASTEASEVVDAATY